MSPKFSLISGSCQTNLQGTMIEQSLWEGIVPFTRRWWERGREVYLSLLCRDDLRKGLML